jgi:hypothetical protein
LLSSDRLQASMRSRKAAVRAAMGARGEGAAAAGDGDGDAAEAAGRVVRVRRMREEKAMALMRQVMLRKLMRRRVRESAPLHGMARLDFAGLLGRRA